MALSVKIKRLFDDIKIPSYAREGDVALDMYSREAGVIKPGEQKTFHAGFALEFPNGYAAIVKDKGGIARSGLATMGGVFDAGYRGEYNVQLINHSLKPYEVKKGDKVGQLMILPVEIVELIEVDELSSSDRGEGRFGSTGLK